MEKMIDISDENIRLHTLCKENEETYLYLQRHASLLAPLYEKNKDLWEYMMPGLKENLKDNEVRCLIYEIGNSDAVGFIEASTGTDNRKEIGIAILPEYRRKGLGYAASYRFIKYLFDNQETNAIYWSVFRYNTPSVKIAEKLGGKVIDEGAMLERAFQMAGYEAEGEVKEKLDELRELTYKIDSENFV